MMILAAPLDPSKTWTKVRLRSLLLGGLALLTACGETERRDSAALADILSEPSSSALSARLGLWFDSHEGAPQRVDTELAAQGFRRLGAAEGCRRYTYRGQPERRLLRDATLQIEIVSCRGEKRMRTISVTRGRS